MILKKRRDKCVAEGRRGVGKCDGDGGSGENRWRCYADWGSLMETWEVKDACDEEETKEWGV